MLNWEMPMIKTWNNEEGKKKGITIPADENMTELQTQKVA
jgi:hypothetical protein